MNKTQIIGKVTRTVGKAGFKLKKHSPEILVGAGVVGVVTSAVMACKATTKAAPIIEDTKKHLDIIHEGVETGEVKSMVNEELVTVPYSDEDAKKDTAIVYAQTALKFAKLYGPSIALGTISIAAILSGHKILRTRNIALASAYATIDKGFKEYRGRVIERFGEELDKELKYNIKAKEIEEVTVDENSKETVTKKMIEVADPNMHSEYARFFDEACAGWDKDAEFNLMFLRHQQSHANDLLHSRGYLFLNEVYDMLGIPRTKAGQVVGWVYDDKNPIGDNFVDFGIYDIHNEKKRDFVNGYERVILLDFNVDGNILDYL